MTSTGLFLLATDLIISMEAKPKLCRVAPKEWLARADRTLLIL
jgi:hypothetical protein